MITSNSFWTTSESQIDPEEDEEDATTRKRREGNDDEVDGIDCGEFRSSFVAIVAFGRRRSRDEGRHADVDADMA